MGYAMSLVGNAHPTWLLKINCENIKMKVFVYVYCSLLFILGSFIIALILFSIKCINFSTVTFSDSEAAHYISRLRKEGKLERLENEQPSICSSLPLYMRKID